MSIVVAFLFRHALPPGFTLKRDKKKEDDTKISIDEFIETERHRLTGKLTPVTAETFAVWKATRKAKKEAEEREMREKKEAAIKAGKGLGGVRGRGVRHCQNKPVLKGRMGRRDGRAHTQITGRDLFTYKPELFVDDEDAGGVDTYVKDVNAEDAESDDENQVRLGEGTRGGRVWGGAGGGRARGRARERAGRGCARCGQCDTSS